MTPQLKRDGIGWILAGDCFPRSLQTAYGRYIFRLMYGAQTGKQRANGIWLRDLPLNLCDLARMGYPHALTAYNLECREIGVDGL